jgi:hypothetical protein
MLKTLLTRTPLALLLAASAAWAAPDSATTGAVAAESSESFQLAAASGHRLSAAQIQKLRSSGIPLVVPGYVPAGYVPSEIKVYNDTSGLCHGKSYLIIYKSAKKESFSIEGNVCGVGDGGSDVPDMQMQIYNKFLGSIWLDRRGPNDQRKSNYIAITDYYKSRLYRIDSPGQYAYNSLRVAGPEIIKIIQNLRPL